ncbi:MAG TPA: hypothetical protein DHV36_10515 [Desulfobacteraceae bacterium]|nr:hypothetical protein [Desulfobacteraceae bacterium]
MDKKKPPHPPYMTIVASLCIWLSIGLMGLAYAEQTNPTSPKADDESLATVEAVQQKIDRINNRLKAASKVKSDRVAQEFGVSQKEFEERLLDLRMLKSSHEQLLYSILALEKIKKEGLAVKDRYENYQAKGMTKEPPYALTFLDAIHDEKSNIQRSQQNINSSLEAIRRELTKDKDRLETLEKEIRRVNDTLSGLAPEDQKPLQWRIDTLEIQRNELEAAILAKGNEIKRYETEKKLGTLQLALLKEQLDVVRKNLAFDPDDLDRQLEGVQERRTEIQEDMDRLRNEQKTVEKKWMAARRDFEKAVSREERALAESYLKSRQEYRETYQVALELNGQAMLLMDRQALAWQKRYALVEERLGLEELKSLKKEIKDNLEKTGRVLQIQQNSLTSLQNLITAIEGRREYDGLSPSIRQHLSVQLTAARRRLERLLSYQSLVLATDSLEKRLLNEIEIRMGQTSIQDHLTDIKKEIVDFWNIEIWAVDNQPVTLRKAATAIIILLLGMVAAKYLLFIFRTRFLERSQFKETTAAAVHKLISYTLYLLVFLFALRMVNIPLTAFAFLGGAVAIGIGFGAQNLINNFISGFMILGERPINMGDLIEVDGVLGMVEEIGARCTRIRTGENIHILVPNSTFLEKNIINWTHSNKKIRTNVTVGVSYGSPVQKVKQQLIEAVKATPRISKYPAPFVIFSDFGDNALIFKVYFWIEIRRVIERREIESNVRFKIDELFNEHGLVIAFPQRDIHLDTLTPLQISLERNGKNQ